MISIPNNALNLHISRAAIKGNFNVSSELCNLLYNMHEKVYLHLLILCSIFSHVIVATSSDENNGEPSDLLIRKRRVLNHEPDANAGVRISDVPYVVQIKKNNRVYCVGSILSHYTVITAATCLMFEIAIYSVHAGAIRTNGGQRHIVTGKKTHFGSTLPRARARDGVGLITVNPPFIYSPYTYKIDLHEGLLLPNTLATVAGWGGFSGRRRGLQSYSDILRSITVPIINHRECVNIYRDFANITDREICTFHANKHCGHTDVGAGLVVNNTLAGILLWPGSVITTNKPDVFLIVQHSEYIQWIRTNIV